MRFDPDLSKLRDEARPAALDLASRASPINEHPAATSESNRRLPAFENFGVAGFEKAPVERDLCSEAAHRQIRDVTVEIGDGKVVVHETLWNARGNDQRLGLASWFSRCTQDGRAVRIVGDQSGSRLATYSPEDGFVTGNDPG